MLIGGLVITVLPAVCRADGATGAAILNVPLSVRQAGMGGVSTGGADILRAWSNPALLADQATRGEIAAGGASMFGGQQSTLGIGVGWKLSPAWTLAAEGMSYAFGFDELNAGGGVVPGSHIARSVQSGGAMLAAQWGPVAFGAGVRSISDSLAGNTATMLAADAGVSVSAAGFSAAVAVRNAGPDLRAAGISVPAGEALPRETRVGASYRSAPAQVSAGAEYASQISGGSQIGVGAEWWPARALAIRAGLADVTGPAMQITAGLSAVVNGYALDYAFATHAIGATHRVSLTYAFGPTAAAFAAESPAAEPSAVVNAPVAPAPAPVAAAPAGKPAGRSTLAVANFDPQNVSAGDAGVIADMFRSELVKQNGFDVVEKANMDKILMEQAFQQSGCTTAECAVKLGKVLNVKYLIVGSFGKLMDQYVLNFRMVETETAKVIYSDDARELSTQREVSKAIAAMTARLVRSFGSK